MSTITISSTTDITLQQLRKIWSHETQIKTTLETYQTIDKSALIVAKICADNQPCYGINTGFGKLATVHIPQHQLQKLQHNLIASHATGVGPQLSDDIIRLIITLKLQTLARGLSGIHRDTFDCLMALINHHIYPLIPAKGSVGASGDLAPLAHLVRALLGEGHVRVNNDLLLANEALSHNGISPLKLQPKEGLALINGTQVSTALALSGLFSIENCLAAALISGTLSVVAAQGDKQAFHEKIHLARRQQGQIKVSHYYRELLQDYAIEINYKRTQDPYCLRCQPQVVGACWDLINYAATILQNESNSVTDNPLLFSESEILYGGNFHAEPVAMAADCLAIAISEIGAISERRIAFLTDNQSSHLPAFLARNPGLQSGLMIAQVTAAALASENKSHAHPASVDSIPTSANQEDHVSMATFAARRLTEMATNTATILAIEMISACQAIDLQNLQHLPDTLKQAYTMVRKHIAVLDDDRYIAPEIEALTQLILTGEFNHLVNQEIFASFA